MGWRKKTGGSVLGLKPRGFASGFDPTRVTQLSWRPRAFLYKGFLSEEECDHLITLAKDKLEKSMVADNESGKSIMSEDEIVADIEARIAAWTFLPVENGESIQILHYENGENYCGGGWGNSFSQFRGKIFSTKDDSWSDCAKKGYAVNPKKVMPCCSSVCILMQPQTQAAYMEVCPVIAGEKWSATKWIHVRSFDKPSKRGAQGECVDEDEHCPNGLQ
ncbi:putative prolyl 4-hydroxylase 7 [Vitis vinifera]|uniref:Putative prolyl 4-hydroxylase 7 n=1 Tax=Vitis vinifera TaxID=29760 RepID=A0A438EFG9_VITVI|nr:putative prolyl 4-hydroxylase 7 [Vitis vinifera]